MEERKSYVTVLSTDSYLPGVIALFESLKRTKPKISKFTVVINENIKPETKRRLLQEGYKVVLKKSIPAPESIRAKNSIGPTSNWNYTFDKFNLFELDEFDKIVYLDSDMYVNQNIDELFDKPHLSAVIAGKNYPGHEFWKELNSGIMVIEPKKGTVEKLINEMIRMSKPKIKKTYKKQSAKRWKTESKPTIKGIFMNLFKYIQSKGDQDVIEEYYHWKEQPNLVLDEKYNVFAQYTDYYISHNGYLKDELAVIHFIGGKKPWMLTEKQIEVYKERCKRRKNVNQLDFFERYLEIIRRKGRRINMQEQVKHEKRTKFSIIIPMKDAEQYITSALASIEQQQFSDIQILVIDDNSATPLSKYRVSKWKEEHPEINLELLETEEGHTGPGGARNVGLDNATGEYVLFLDADDKLNENALNSINQAVDDNPQTDIFVLGYQLTRIDCNGNEKKPLNLPAGKLQESRAFQIGANTAGSIWNHCIRRSLFGEKDDKHKIRFKENCKFEDLPTKVNLFVRNKKKMKAVPTMTHTQYSRPNTSVTGTLSLRDVPRLTQAHREIANLKKSEDNIGLKDKIYIDFRKISFLATCSWLIQKALRNKLDRRKQQKIEEKQSVGIGR